MFVFCADINAVGGKQLSFTARENGTSGVRDQFLWWHFRQCVFANMRGVGEPLWDYGPDEGGDVVSRILEADPKGAMLGAEIASRLALTPFLPLDT